MTEAIYVDNNTQLAECCQQWGEVSVLALDTEFIRTDTFYPIAGLIQLSDGRGSYLIDPLTIDDFEPLKALLVDENIIKVFHSCSEDLEVFDKLFGLLPTPLFDSQIAAAMAGLDFSMSYQKLVDALLQVHVEKGETRSNWLQRPLTESQKHYAALDVIYLHQVYQQLSSTLEQQRRLDWLQRECADQLAAFSKPTDHMKKIKSAWKLSQSGLLLLQRLCDWREQEARRRDKPRGRILKDRSCFSIAERPPRNSRSLSGVEDVGPATVRQYGEKILEIIDGVESASSADYPPLLPKPLPISTAKTMKAMKTQVREVAEALKIPQEILVKKRDYEALIRSGLDGGDYQLPPSLQGWRREVVGDGLLKFLAGGN